MKVTVPIYTLTSGADFYFHFLLDISMSTLQKTPQIQLLQNRVI